ncbi:hypothetical protein LTR02_017749 [Friedmanniomyces endolithicus]|nr:hypothetical protein LTR02_017749 [Friedmanniomyces endolithicus]
MPKDTSEPDVIYYTHYCPPGVHRVIANGTATFVGEVDDTTVLKYPAEPGGDLHSLEHEYRIYKHIGPHRRIIAAKNFTKEGLYLERAPNGTVHEYLAEGEHTVTIQRRVAWVQQLVEAVQHLHRHNVIHTDLHPGNILLDSALRSSLRICSATWSPSRGRQSGSGSEANPVDIVSGEDGWYDMVISRFERGEFPLESHACAAIARKCWRGEYSSADEVMADVTAVDNRCEQAYE